MITLEHLFSGISRDERNEAELTRYLLGTSNHPEATKSCLANSYPLDAAGYAYAFNLEIEALQLMQTFNQLGFVVVREVVPPALCKGLINRAKEIVSGLQGNSSQEPSWKPGTLPIDDSGTPILSRGFLEIYHDNSWAAIRQSPRLYQLWVLLWGQI